MEVRRIGLGLSPPCPAANPAALRSTRPGFQFGPPPAQGQDAPPGTALNLLRPGPSEVAQVIAEAFDAEYYLGTYPDVAAAGVDPLQHYAQVGAAEFRNPTRWFDTRDYVDANPDVQVAGCHPFWHYLVQGRAQGRPPRRLHASQRAALQAERAAVQGAAQPSPSMALLRAEALQEALAGRLTTAAGVVLSLSHDRYTRSVGGVQILVSDEQHAFNAQSVAYLHIAPATPRLCLAPAGETLPIFVTLDGAYIGTTGYADLAAALAGLRPRLPEFRRMVLHCLLGHQTGRIPALHAALAPGASVFWANDYEAVCPGYNLLRNGVEFCGAPPPDSMACRVCVHGPARAGHLLQMEALFAAVPMHVVAPSEAALHIWQAGARLPYASAQVHEYAALVPPACPARDLPGQGGSHAADLRVPLRVAFAGMPLVQKGWQGFSALAARLHGMPGCHLFHFTAELPDQVPLGVEVVPVRVSAGQRGAMTEALRAHGINLVLVLSPWPETFCLVAYEALAAGADLVALKDGGNVPDLVLKTGRGVVAADIEAVTDFFLSGDAARYAALAAAGPRPGGRLVSRGMTATLRLPGDAA